MKKIVALALCLILAVTTVTAMADAPAYTAGTYQATVPGLWGDMTVETTFSDHAIESVKVLDNVESPGLCDWPFTLIPQAIVAQQSLAVDTVAGVTISSRALLNAVAKCVEQAGVDPATLNSVAEKAPVQTEYNADVIIIGGGGAGLSAATAATENGSSVIIVEKTGFLGGNSIVAGGIYNCADPEMQATVTMTDNYRETIRKAIEEEPVSELHAEVQSIVAKQFAEYEASGAEYLFDSPEWHALQTWNGGDKVADLNLDLVLGRNALDGWKWLQSLGLEIQNKIGQGAGSLYIRTHYEKLPNTTGIIKAFSDTLNSRNNFSYVLSTTAQEIIMTDGRATGVKAVAADGTEVTFTANKGVILATGGFAGNVAMRQQYCEGEKWPDLGSSLNTSNMPAVTGDGIRMAEAVGAQLVDMDQIQLLHTTNPIYGTTGDASMPLSTAGAIFVNQEGNRFWREDGRRDDLSIAARAQNEKGIFWVVESAEAIPDPSTTKTLDGRTVQYMLDHELSDYVTGNTIEELAEAMGVDAANLKAAIEDYNAHVESGEADAFGRTLLQYKLETPPFYAFTRAPSAHHTMGGVRINESAQVIGTDGNAIPGLYAAGEVTGDIHGGNRLGGNAISDFVVFGRIAGTNAAE